LVRDASFLNCSDPSVCKKDFRYLVELPIKELRGISLCF